VTDQKASRRIERLTEQHDRTLFSCGIDELDRYFRSQVGQDIRRRVASCFVLVGENRSVEGYYTLASTSIALADLPPELVKKLPRYPSVPATLMGRLAVEKRAHGRGLGEMLLLGAFNRTLRSEIASYAFVVDAKDEKAERFYRRYNFLRLASTGRRLFLPMSEIATLLA
jgi:predicted GNAT family N-acyltransferase